MPEKVETPFSKKESQKIGLPPRYVFFTFDQICEFLQIRMATFKQFVYYDGRTPGPCARDQIKAINIAREGDPPEWRISEVALKNFLRFKGIKFYTRTYSN